MPSSCTSTCGDGVVASNEACDDGNTVSGDGCNATCTSTEVCGNGFLDPGEPCDDGNLDELDGCLSTCQTDIDLDGVSDVADACDGLPAGSYLEGLLEITNLSFRGIGIAVDPTAGPGSDGGLLLGTYQNGGPIGADNTAIIDPTTLTFGGRPVAVGYYPDDPAGNRPGAPFAAPALFDHGDGRLSFELPGWTVYWNGVFVNQGPTDTTLIGYDPVTNTASGYTGSNVLLLAVDGGQGGQTVGSYNAATGVTHLEWNSVVGGGGFAGMVGRWVLDGVLVACTGCDSDGDGVLDSADLCPGFDDSIDTDGDGVPDGCDLCVTDPFDDQDGDCLCADPADPEGLLGFDTDNDGDGVANIADAFPDNPNEWADNDGDGVGDNADLDDDNDCYPDTLEMSFGSDPLVPDVVVGDVDCSGTVSITDLIKVRGAFGMTASDPGWDPRLDVNGSSTISITDLIQVRGHFGSHL